MDQNIADSADHLLELTFVAVLTSLAAIMSFLIITLV